MLNRVPSISLCVLCGFMWAAPRAAAAEQRDAERPNIVVFISDDHGWADSEPYGDRIVRTPNLARLAEEGMRFTRAFVASPACGPSRAALYTALWPQHSGAMANHTPIDPDIRTLPAYFRELGYRPVLMGKKHIKPRDAYSAFELPGGIKPDEKGRRGLWRDLDTGAVDRFLADYVQRDDRKPLCLIVADTSPHVYWPPNEGYDPFALNLPPYLVDTPTTRRERAEYYTDVTKMDRNLGRVLDSVERHGLADNTLFIYTSDNGAQWPHAKWNLYDAGVRTPFIVRWPGKVEPDATSGAMVSFVDVLPTLIEAAGGEPPSRLDGRSFLPVLLGERDEHREVIFATHTGDPNFNESPMRAVRTGRYKYILNLRPDREYITHITDADPLDGRDYWESWLRKAEHDERAAKIVRDYQHRPAEELYDLRTDPYEMVNLAGDPAHRDELERMRDWRRKLDEEEEARR